MGHLLLAAVFLSTASLFGGCVEPEILYRAAPVSVDTVWYSGREFVTRTADSVTVSVAFENELQGVMTFYVVVGNDGSSPVLVAPEAIHYEGEYQRMEEVDDYETGYVTHNPVSMRDTTYAIDPEKQLQGLDMQAAQTNATYATNSGLNAAAGLLQIVGDVAMIGQKKTDEQEKSEREASRQLKESRESANLNYSLQSASIADQRAYWQNAALRKTTLFIGNAIGGKVRIPVTPRMSRFALLVPVGEQSFEFEFEQHRLRSQ